MTLKDDLTGISKTDSTQTDIQPGSRSSSRHPIDVLVVDDSATVRQVLKDLLSQERDISARVASDPIIALERMRQKRPDVIILDLEMPRMHGLTFLNKIMAEDPLPIVVCSGLAGSGTDEALRALEGGAVGIVTKPTLGIGDFLCDSASMLIDTIRSAAGARPRVPLTLLSRWSELTTDAASTLPVKSLGRTTAKVVALGASTGGTEALRALLESMPVDCPGLVAVQHMPEMFTAAFARRLDQLCRIEVKEAADGDRIITGRALIAPGNRHTLVQRSGGHYIVRVTDGPLVSRHRPSVDVLFRSVAGAAGPSAVGVIMTGMGDDGADGLLQMRNAGAWTIAQNEASCVVFGMPKEAIARGAVDQVVSLDGMASSILDRTCSGAGRPISEAIRDACLP